MDQHQLDTAKQVAELMAATGWSKTIVTLAGVAIMTHWRELVRMFILRKNGTSSVPGQIDKLTDSVERIAEDVSEIKTRLAVGSEKMDQMEKRIDGLERREEKH